MGTYSHLSITELEALRVKLTTSLTDRLTSPTQASSNGRSVSYQQTTADIKREIESVNAELQRRQGGAATRGPIYII